MSSRLKWRSGLPLSSTPLRVDSWRPSDLYPLLRSVMADEQWHTQGELVSLMRPRIPVTNLTHMQYTRWTGTPGKFYSEGGALRHLLSQLARDIGAERRGAVGDASYRQVMESRTCSVCGGTFLFPSAARRRGAAAGKTCSPKCTNRYVPGDSEEKAVVFCGCGCGVEVPGYYQQEDGKWRQRWFVSPEHWRRREEEGGE